MCEANGVLNGATAMKAEVIKTGITFDGKRVELWSDGAMTFGTGQWVKGAGASRNVKTISANVRAGFKVMGNISILTAEEISEEVYKARKQENR